MTEYKLTDKWPEEYRGKKLRLNSSGGFYRLEISLDFRKTVVNFIDFDVETVESNPDLFEKVEEPKCCHTFIYGDVVNVANLGGKGIVISKDEIDSLEKKARAGEELERKVRVLSDIDNRQFPFRHYLVEAGKEYREAVK